MFMIQITSLVLVVKWLQLGEGCLIVVHLTAETGAEFQMNR
jgi:hypothetical protein